QLSSYADNLISPTVSTLPGVAQVNVQGQKRFAVRVRVRPDALAARNLTVEDIAAALNAANANTPVGILEGARQTLTIEANEQLTGSVQVLIRNDRSVSIREAIHDVKVTLGITAALVILVIYLFLRRPSATIIPALSLPISLIGTLALMKWLGLSLDNVSLLG